MSHRARSGWRIASLAAIIGLLGSGMAGLAVADTPSGAAFIKRLSPEGGPLRLAYQPDATVASTGLQLLREAAAACQDTPYRGSQVVRWWDQGGVSASVVDVWHQSGQMTLVQAVGPASGAAAPDAGAADQEPDGILGMSGRILALLESNYLPVYTGPGSADQRKALVVEVWRPDGSLAARFWLDAVTKLPLRRQMFDAAAHLISDDAFTSLDLGDPGRGHPPAAAAPWAAQAGQGGLAALRAKGWQVPASLPGKLTLFAATQTSTPSGPVVNLSYSDGLAVVSLFVQRGVLGAARARLAAGQDGLLGPIYSVNPTQRSFAWSTGGFVYTLVADAPPATVSQVVAALTGAPRLGFWQRIGRGLHRLVSWINPLR